MEQWRELAWWKQLTYKEGLIKEFAPDDDGTEVVSDPGFTHVEVRQ